MFEVLDNKDIPHIVWFKILFPADRSAWLNIRVEVEDFFHEYFLEHGIYLGHTKNQVQVIGTSELEMTNKLIKHFEDTVTELESNEGIVCIL